MRAATSETGRRRRRHCYGRVRRCVPGLGQYLRQLHLVRRNGLGILAVHEHPRALRPLVDGHDALHLDALVSAIRLLRQTHAVRHARNNALSKFFQKSSSLHRSASPSRPRVRRVRFPVGIDRFILVPPVVCGHHAARPLLRNRVHLPGSTGFSFSMVLP